MKKIIALLACIALLASSTAVRTPTAASEDAVAPVAYFEDDFSTGDLSRWVTLDPDMPQDQASIVADGDGYVMRVVRSSADTPAIYKPAETVLPSASQINRVIYTVRHESKTPSANFPLRFLFDYVDAENYKAYDIVAVGTTLYYWGLEMVDGTEKRTSTSPLTAEFDPSQWFTVTLTYQEDGKCGFSFVQGDISFNLRWTLTYNTRVCMIQVINTDYTEFKKVQVECEGYEQYLAEQYCEKYAALFTKKPGNITLEDEAVLQAALAEFEALIEPAKNYLFEEKNKLDAYAKKLEALKNSAAFDENSPMLLYNWDVLWGNGNNVFAVQEGEEDILQMVACGADNITQLTAIELKDSAYNSTNALVKQIAFDVRYQKPDGNRQIQLIYDYTDPENYGYLILSHIGAPHNVCAQHAVKENGTETISLTSTKLDIDLSQWFRVIFDYSEAGKCSILFLQDRDGENQQRWATTKTTAADEKSVVLTSFKNSTETVSYKNISITVIEENEQQNLEKQKNMFLTAYNELLRLQDSTLSVNYKSEVEQALTDFGDLDPAVQDLLLLEGNKLRDIQNKINALLAQGRDDSAYIRAEDDYSDFTEDFENGLVKWVDCFSDNLSGLDIAEDAQLNSKVLKMQGGNYPAITAKSFAMPQKAFISSVTYKMRLGEALGSVYNGIHIYYSYVDENNYEALEIFDFYDTDQAFSRRRKVVQNGEVSYTEQNLASMGVDYTQWCTVTITYTSDGRAYISITDGENTDAVSYAMQSVKGAFALSAPGRSSGTAQALYYDDVQVTMEAGTWDEDLEINDIFVYYAGNTIADPDDVIQLSGEGLYDLVSSIRVREISDLSNSTPAYLNEYTHNRHFVEGQWVQPVNMETIVSDPAWDTAQTVQILQSTDNAVKFIMPSGFKKGIFAVKLYGNDSRSDADDAVIYINNPEIDYTQGDEGDIALPGGTLRIIGKALAPYVDTSNGDYTVGAADTHKICVQLKNATASYELENITVQSAYSLQATLPADLPQGSYEITVYNGYGDGSCWSAPVAVTVGISPRDAWPKTVYNIRDFGANGLSTQNATPMVVNALSTIEGNGGGVLYFPKGIYNMFHSIVIPENTVLKGDGVDRSIIVWSPDQWDWHEFTPYLMGVSKNVEIRDLAFYGTRMGNLYTIYGDSAGESENLYFTNVRIHINPTAGTITEGSGTATTGNMSVSEMYAMALEECKNLISFSAPGSNSLGTGGIKINNLRFKDCYYYANDVMFRRPFALKANYLNMYNCSWHGGWGTLDGDNNIWEYNTFDQNCIAFLGRGVYSQNNKLQNKMDNNRELFVADGSGFLQNATVQQLDPEDNTRFRIVGRTYSTGALIGTQIYIISGQGMGQTRQIIANDGDEFTVDSPFVVAPNRNSRASFGTIRESMYFVKNLYYNGAAGGFFGRFSDVVYDGNTHERNGTFYFQSRSGDRNWYLSIVNDRFIDAYFFHNNGMGTGSEWSGYADIWIYSDQPNQASLAMTFRHNYLDGYRLRFNPSFTNGLSDIVVDKNVFENAAVGISCDLDTGIEAIFLYKNSFFNVDTPISARPAFLSAVNSTGSKRFIQYSDTADGTPFPLGDVNTDGSVTLKDCSLVKYYLSELAVLTEEQKYLADVDQDNTITLKDARKILDLLMQ